MRPGTEDSRVLDLRAGDLVEVRSREEILATLDREARLDALPFMPEMFQYCGKRYRVFKRADKTCDTISSTGTRRLFHTVHLEGLRCDGQAHRRQGPLPSLLEGSVAHAGLIAVRPRPTKTPSSPPTPSPPDPLPAGRCTEEAVLAATHARRGPGTTSEERFACQATELVRATSPLAWWDPRQYARDVRSGNVRVRDLIRGLALGAFNTIQRRRAERPSLRQGSAYDDPGRDARPPTGRGRPREAARRDPKHTQQAPA